MTSAELAGIAIHADDPEEIRTAIRTVLATVRVPVTGDDETYRVAACAHAIGHLGRRFGTTDADLVGRVTALGEAYPASRPIQGALVDLWDDLETFVPRAEWTPLRTL